MVRFFIKEILLCVKDLHDNGIVHLDIKCENFLYRPNHKYPLILIDFGHAEVLPINVVKQFSGGSYGTVPYLCPEGYDGIYSSKSDVWSIGICMHILATNLFPFDGEDSDEEYEYNARKYNLCLGDIFSKESHEKDFLLKCLSFDMSFRPKINTLLEHPFITNV
jgi:serine/threonine protein kinase